MFIAFAILGLLTALAVVPIDTSPLPSHAHPINEYARAVSAYDTLQQRERDSVMRDGASLMLVHGYRTPRVIVLVHGLTNSPRQFRDLAEQFYDRGYNVLVPRLPLHGLVQGDVALLKTLTAEKYRDYADNAIDVADGLGDSVFVMGLSAGGNVAAWIGYHRPDVARVVVIAPAITLGKVPHLLDAPAMSVMERVPNVTYRQKPDTARPHAYFGVSTRALGETLRFAASVMNDAAERAPVVTDLTMVVNDNDHTIDAGTALALAQRWGDRGGTPHTIYRFDGQLGLPHDIIDPTERCGMTEIVYPALIALMERRTPEPTHGKASPCSKLVR